jgi:hypothetical protein
LSYEAVTSLCSRSDVKELVTLEGKYLEFKMGLAEIRYLKDIDLEAIYEAYKNAISVHDLGDLIDFTNENMHDLMRLQFKA